jgi:DNA invertase Pin-like site-specific DNA recombinase
MRISWANTRARADRGRPERPQRYRTCGRNSRRRSSGNWRSKSAGFFNAGASCRPQYRLVERAVLLGWPRERAHVIDDDLGKSATSSNDRYGFQRLIAEVGLGKAGLVMSLDASRLARNNVTGINFWNCARYSGA